MIVRRLIVPLALALGLAGISVGGSAAASPTVRMAIVHAVRGCHAWTLGSKKMGAAPKLTVRRGTRLVIRVSCPMDFDFVQTAGPRLNLTPARTYAGTTRTIVFRKAGVYRLRAKNVQTSEERELHTLGPDNTLTLTIRVK